MPKFEALYYPYFEPSVRWLRKYLLVFDSVSTIVPKDVNLELSFDILQLLDLMPDVFKTVSPSEWDITFDGLNLDRLRKAFQLIKENNSDGVNSGATISINKSDWSSSIAFESGLTSIHNDKVSKDVFYLLQEFELIEPELSGLVDNNYQVVNSDAGDLILSFLADRIGRQRGLNTVTDKKVDFVMNSLNGFDLMPAHEARHQLACSLLKFEVPSEIEFLEPRQYKEIRDSYFGIRESFHEVVTNLSILHLDYIENPEVLSDRIKVITKEFDKEISDFKSSKVGRNVKRWAPLVVGGIVTIVGAAFGVPQVIIPSAVAAVTVDIVQEGVLFKAPETEREKVVKLLAGIHDDIINASDIKRMI